jgi:hypothetical protein
MVIDVHHPLFPNRSLIVIRKGDSRFQAEIQLGDGGGSSHVLLLIGSGQRLHHQR